MVSRMTLPLKPDPSIPATITTSIDPIFADKKQMAAMFAVSERSIDYWRERGILPYIKIKGTLRFDVAQCLEAVKKRFSRREPGDELWARKPRKQQKHPVIDRVKNVFREEPTISFQSAAVKAGVHMTTAWRARREMIAAGELPPQ